MTRQQRKITVFYDGSCPGCVRDRASYERWQRPDDQWVEWLDITGQEEYLRSLGIDPERALLELHLLDQEGRILRELDAYRLLMGRIPRLKLLGWLIGLPGIRQVTAAIYHILVRRRLQRTGRWPDED